MTILEMAGALRTKKVSSLELTNDTLAKIARENPRLNAFITVLEDSARARASAMDAELSAWNRPEGPCTGSRSRTRIWSTPKACGRPAARKYFKDFVPDHDADIAINLERAGVGARRKN